MKFRIDWRVVESSDAGTKTIGEGSAIKDAADRAAMQQTIDDGLLPLLRSHFPQTAFSDRDYIVQIEETTNVVPTLAVRHLGTWRIVSKTEEDENGGIKAWDKDFAEWVDFTKATVFKADERDAVELPEGGEWLEDIQFYNPAKQEAA